MAPVEDLHRGTTHPAPPHLITTRIDGDDAMAVDFMAAAQAQFAGQERLFVNFPRGIQIDRSGAVHSSRILSSPFLSLIERRAGRAAADRLLGQARPRPRYGAAA